MSYMQQIERFVPVNEQEQADQREILRLIHAAPADILCRTQSEAHITSSGLIFSPSLEEVLFVRHRVYDTWCWTGGHADGEEDLLAVALREAREETGLERVEPLSREILSLDILPVWGHQKKGKYVSSHLHLSAAYALVAEKNQPLRSAPEENTGVAWFPVKNWEQTVTEPYILYVYRKILDRIRS